jgi:hypothetical protein
MSKSKRENSDEDRKHHDSAINSPGGQDEQRKELNRDKHPYSKNKNKGK